MNYKALIGVLLIACSFGFAKNDTENQHITWSKQIKPIFDTYCAMCHHNGTTYYPGGRNLNHYDSMKKIGLNGDLREHVLIKKDMPMSPGWQTARRLSDSQLVFIDSWIRQGCFE